MNFKKKILVFPCGSEIGLEIYRSLCFSTHVELIGASSTNDHGRFVYSNYIGDIPFSNHPDFINTIKDIVIENSIDAVYPAMDSVINLLKKNEDEIGCKVIASPARTTDICLSKKKTYELLQNTIRTPKHYLSVEEVDTFPVFLKPDVGYGSRGVYKAENKSQILSHLEKHDGCLILEFLPGDEYTVDCFTDQEGNLRFAGARKRKRIMNGISVNTSTQSDNKEFWQLAEKINKAIEFRGAWFFQVKENAEGEPVLMEIASRLGGSSSVYRAQGINFALLSVYSTFGLPITIRPNQYEVELDRALNVCFKANIDFSNVYVDYDDTLLVNNKVNSSLMRFLFDCINKNKKITLITRHAGDLGESLKKHRISELFHEIIHLKNGEKKSDAIPKHDTIFIDDSFAERNDVVQSCGIPVFSPDMVADLII